MTDRAVLLSIKPKYCELIASGKKTVEVRKTIPKIYHHERQTMWGIYIIRRILRSASRAITAFRLQPREGKKRKAAGLKCPTAQK